MGGPGWLWDPGRPGCQGPSHVALTLCPPWAPSLVWGSCPSCTDVEQGAPRAGSCLQSREEPCGQAPGTGQRVSGRRPAACGASRTPDSSPPDPRPPLSAQTSTEDADARPPASLGSTLAQSRALHGSGCPTASPSSGVTVPGPPGHHVPTNPLLPQREKLPSSPTSPHMAMRAVGAAQGGLPVAARPAAASSRLTGVTLGALLRKDQTHPG